MAELEQRIDHALAVAQASETAALEIGAAALDAAAQARRAAELAERASRTAVGARAASQVVAVPPPPASEPEIADAAVADSAAAEPSADLAAAANGDRPPADSATPVDLLQAFKARADRIGARFDRLRAPVPTS